MLKKIKALEYGIWAREMLCSDNARTATLASHSLFTPLASTPDEPLAGLLLASSLLGLKDYVKIISCSANSAGDIQDVGEGLGVIVFYCLAYGGQVKSTALWLSTKSLNSV